MKALRLGKFMRRMMICCLAVAVVFCFESVAKTGKSYAKSYPKYTISAKSKPYYKKYRRCSTYNKKTKQYYLLRSYMERFEKKGGGTLVLKKGTYNMPIAVYVPKNVTIIFKNGVKINKTTSTGTRKLSASGAVFVLCAPKVANASHKYARGKFPYGYTGYNGVSNVHFIGKGKVTFDLNYINKAIAIYMGHTRDTSFTNLYFKESKNSHFMEVDASYNMTVSGCKFRYAKNTVRNKKEAINLDTPDLNTHGFNANWTSFDKTADQNVTIKNCTFTDLYRAVGTHNYSPDHPQTNIVLDSCVINNMKSDSIDAMYWHDCTIKNCKFSNISGTKRRAILCGGTQNLTLTGNTFSKVARVAQFYSWKDDGYDVIDPLVTDENKTDITNNNKYSNISENFVRITTGWKDTLETPNWTDDITEVPITDSADPVQ